jgi:putative phosphoesterase
MPLKNHRNAEAQDRHGLAAPSCWRATGHADVQDPELGGNEGVPAKTPASAAETNHSCVTRVGVIADTHRLVRPEALVALAGSELIVHAGDVGGPEVLDALRVVAPVVAVRGNNDRGPWAHTLAESEIVAAGGVRLYVIHNVAEMDLKPAAAGFAAVIAGHSHKPRCEERGGVLWFKPGSAGPRRFKLPIAVGRLEIALGRVSGEIIELHIP